MTSAGPAPPPAYRLGPRNGAPWLGLFLARWAERLRSSPAGEAFLVEQSWNGRGGDVRLLPFSRALATAMEAQLEGSPLAGSAAPLDEAAHPPPSWTEAWGWVEVRGTAPAPVVPSDRPPLPPIPTASGSGSTTGPGRSGLAEPCLLLPGGRPYWVAVQTHWVVGADAELWGTTRGRIAAEHPEDLPALRAGLEAHLRRLAGSEPGTVLAWRESRPGRRRRRAWDRGSRPRWGGGRPYPLRRGWLALAAPFPIAIDASDDPRLRHAVLLGASGSGKTAALARLARDALREGRSVVLFDVHGDLAPRVVGGSGPVVHDRLVGIDVVGTPSAVPGLSVFGPVPPADREALVAHLVAAFKRLSTENGETFWGFRLERLFETFLHVVQEQGGDLVDLWSLLTDPRRREAARLTTARPEVARFLDELDALVRRQPEFLWPAASRVAKVVGSPILTALLAPREGTADVGSCLRAGGSALWRLPIGELGPEGVTFAVTLLLTRAYLEQVRRAETSGTAPGLRVLFVLDEAHLFPSRLLSEIVAEGRKFGLGLVLATQYPARLAPELREALTGAAGTVYLFRIPWATAAGTGAWVGLDAETSLRTLPALPPGWAVVGSTGPGADRRLVALPPPPDADPAAWQELVRRSAEQYGAPVPYREGPTEGTSERIEEELLFGLVALEAEGGIVTRLRLLAWLDGVDSVAVLPVLDALVRRGWVEAAGETLLLAPAGAERVGLTARTGARPESAEHRALLVAALRIFARHRERLEILRQGRFDTRLPDGRVIVLPRAHRGWSPGELARYLDRRRGAWVWRAFGGRDVWVEAEVSGATRRERVERDWAKAREAGAFLLCLVGDAARARAVRRFLDRALVPRDRAAVWTLRTGCAGAARPSGT